MVIKSSTRRNNNKKEMTKLSELIHIPKLADVSAYQTILKVADHVGGKNIAPDLLWPLA